MKKTRGERRSTKFESFRNRIYLLSWMQIHVNIIGMPVFMRKVHTPNRIIVSTVNQNGFTM
jgi:hypothetical protein